MFLMHDDTVVAQHGDERFWMATRSTKPGGQSKSVNSSWTRSDRSHAVVACVVLDLGEAEGFENRWHVVAESTS